MTLRHDGAPCDLGGCAAKFVGLARDEVAFEVEVIVERGVDRGALWSDAMLLKPRMAASRCRNGR
jgi:hypothetical protein